LYKNTLDKDQAIFVNLLPAYAFDNTREYERYLLAYSNITKKTGGTVIYSVANYPFTKGGFRKDYFLNLDLLRKYTSNNIFWSYVLASGHAHYNDPGLYEIAFTALTPLLYGAKGIIYFPFSSILSDNEHKFAPGLINKDGTKTKKFEYAKAINSYIKAELDGLMQGAEIIETVHLNHKTSGAINGSRNWKKGMALIDDYKGFGLIVTRLRKKQNDYLLLFNPNNSINLSNLSIATGKSALSISKGFYSYLPGLKGREVSQINGNRVTVTLNPAEIRVVKIK
jgi:hypothetical protein